MKLGGSKGRKKARLIIIHVLLAPFKALCSAADFYVKAMNDCQGMVGGYTMAVNSGRPPYTLGKPITAARKRSKREKKLGRIRSSIVVDKCYSFDIGKIGRIDEEEPCSFREDDFFFGNSNLAKQRLHRNWLIDYVMARDAEALGNHQ
ncbi:unnamed protein product [Linum trigynum]|uniref:Uncharacterized protein n=1 Tax=Linum trigynum TaxID=586398 RepID=A0AAV2CK58_9ROSI